MANFTAASCSTASFIAPGVARQALKSTKKVSVGSVRARHPQRVRIFAASSAGAGTGPASPQHHGKSSEQGTTSSASSSRGSRTTPHAIASPAADVQLTTLRSGTRVSEWWKKGPQLSNMHEVHSADEFVAYLHEAANLDKKNGRARLVCVKFFAGWCPGCRSLHPKLQKIAQKEFPDVLFLKVHMDALPDLCESLGVSKLPWIQLYKGSDGLVEQFSVSMSAKGLAQLRLHLDYHRSGETGLLEGQQGPATLVAADGWPVWYSAKQRAVRRQVGKFYQRYLTRARPDPLSEGAMAVEEK